MGGIILLYVLPQSLVYTDEAFQGLTEQRKLFFFFATETQNQDTFS